MIYCAILQKNNDIRKLKKIFIFLTTGLQEIYN